MIPAPSAACQECLSRALLLHRLAGHIDTVVASRAGSRARELLALDDESLVAALCPGGGEEVLEYARSASARGTLSANLAAEGCWSVCPHRGPYPEALRVLGDAAPKALFGCGRAELLAGCEPSGMVTLVGSRRAGSYGLDVAERLSLDLSNAGVTVISGLALGIDSAAHEGALAGLGSTVAVLGTGPERPYPRSRRGLYGRVKLGGLVISELPPGTPTFRWMFPARNRIMAALAAITVVVEATERSGSLITAEMALDIGRAVGAVPGPVNSWRSAGANRLLAEGAIVVRDAGDVLDAVCGVGTHLQLELEGPPIGETELVVLEAVEAGASVPDEVAVSAGLSYAQASAALSRLERDGYLRCGVSGRYARTALVAGHLRSGP